MMKSLFTSLQRNIRAVNKRALSLNSNRSMFTMSLRSPASTQSALHSYQKRDFIYPFGRRKPDVADERELRRRYNEETNEERKRELKDQLNKLEEKEEADESSGAKTNAKSESSRKPEAGRDEQKKAEETKTQRGNRSQKEDDTSSSSSDEDLELTKEDIKKIQNLIKEQDKKLEEHKTMIQSLRAELRHSLAETESTVQRYKKEVESTKEFAISKFAKDLIEISDTLKLAMKHTDEKAIEETKDDNPLKEPYANLVEGVKLTSRTFENIFKRHGVIELDPMGQKFDPNIHEAMYVFEDPSKTPGTVGYVIQTGWKIGDRVLKAPKVGTVKASASNKSSDKSEDSKKIEKVMEDKKKEEKIEERIKETEPAKKEEELLKKNKRDRSHK